MQLDPVAPVPGVQHRRPAAQGQGPAHRGRQLEARFVEEDDMGLAFPGFARMRGSSSAFQRSTSLGERRDLIYLPLGLIVMSYLRSVWERAGRVS